MTLSIADKQSDHANKRFVSPDRSGRHISPSRKLVFFDEEDQKDYTDDWIKSLSQPDEPKKNASKYQFKIGSITQQEDRHQDRYSDDLNSEFRYLSLTKPILPK